MESELHPFTHISVKNAMVEFLQLIRTSQISKNESEKFLSFVKSILPFPDQMPKNMNTLLKGLNTADYFNRRTICILCEKELQKNQNLCSQYIHALLSNIVSRHSSDIEEYKKFILNPDSQTPYDIPLGKAYQRLLRQYSNENLLTILLHVDGISVVKSTNLKLWICAASLIELPPSLRTRRSNMFLVSIEAQLTNRNVYGHLGTSILDEVVDVSLPRALIIDYAHVSLLRHFRDVIKTVASSLAPAVREKIDVSLRAQRFPYFFHRKMRGVADFSFIKAVELKNLLLYGFIPHFMNHLTIDQLCFISLFTIGVRLFHADNVFTPIISTTANELLCKYYADHHIYFLHHANFVLHLHQHFQDVYEYHGPLSSINTFSQEDFIGYIKKNKNGTTSFENLFAYYYNIDVLLKKFKETNLIRVVDGPLDVCLVRQENPLFHELSNYHQKSCDRNNYCQCIKTFRRCLIFKKMYHSLQYVKRKNTTSYFVKYLFRPGNFEFGSIKVFFQHQQQTYALIQHFQVINAFSDYLKDSRYYGLLKQAIDNFYFVLKKTNITRIVLVEKIQTHMIVFQNIPEKAFILATPISAITEHD
ncbi:unnamed protein product [Rotaria socialis]|uniref:Uncharacterized protein n=1 Tax=Rotaria socialis TaxID=392032 RepID=A0A817U8H1_9BILA|nr:unnamed protein product [Rotaria socialis]CAF4480196.1 unnamed protein product [Rotaria socialis]CAF4538557.1 unnamed protein product [Rotaria socialis]CAF4573449.1 unnamed protein product [Rotaria socialis]